MIFRVLAVTAGIVVVVLVWAWWHYVVNGVAER